MKNFVLLICFVVGAIVANVGFAQDNLTVEAPPRLNPVMIQSNDISVEPLPSVNTQSAQQSTSPIVSSGETSGAAVSSSCNCGSSTTAMSVANGVACRTRHVVRGVFGRVRGFFCR